MPRISSVNDDGKPIDRYLWSARYVTACSGINEAIRNWRKEAIKDREEFLSFQNACGKAGDRDGAKFFKDCSQRELKRQRACTYMLPWFGDPDTNQKAECPTLWPLDLEEQLDEISNRIVLLFG